MDRIIDNPAEASMASFMSYQVCPYCPPPPCFTKVATKMSSSPCILEKFIFFLREIPFWSKVQRLPVPSYCTVLQKIKFLRSCAKICLSLISIPLFLKVPKHIKKNSEKQINAKGYCTGSEHVMVAVDMPADLVSVPFMFNKVPVPVLFPPSFVEGGGSRWSDVIRSSYRYYWKLKMILILCGYRYI